MNLEAATAWLDEHVVRTGPAEVVRSRAWATVLRAETGEGPVWLKAPAATTAFEVRLYPLLARTAPAHVLRPIAVDAERGWVLLPDGGPPLGEKLSGDALIDAMTAALPAGTVLQRALSADDLLGVGVTDMRPAVMAARFDEAVAVTGAPGQIVAQRSAFAQACARLADAPGGASLDHNDLHPWNVLDGHRFYDWGDAVVAHPFACMLVPLGWLHYSVGVPLDDPRFSRLRDAYLEVFSDLAPHAVLVETLELACHVGKVARALTWHRAIGDLPPDHEHAGAPLEGLAALLDASFLSRV